ncbi:MAG: hypothetical protein LBC56_04515 [Oscillospiraceae bacterium]|jgi:hypothetical protein|nr:hypothetical protein [Oscillospiraceae bacterium]
MESNNNKNSLSPLSICLLILSLIVLIALVRAVLLKTVLADKNNSEAIPAAKAQSIEAILLPELSENPPAEPSETQSGEASSEEASEESLPESSAEFYQEPVEISEATPSAPTEEQYTGEAKFETVYYDANHYVYGRVLGLDPEEYALVLFIKVEGRYYVKPTWASAKTYLYSDGSFGTAAYTNDSNRWNDQTATHYSVFCVPLSFDINSMSSFSDLATVRSASVLALEDLPTGN